jgi:glycosyltransferase involved in cell wall biosynthesis
MAETRRLRVAMLGQYPEDVHRIVGGVEAVVAALASEMALRPEVDLHILRCATRGIRSDCEERDGLTIHWLPRGRVGRLTFHAREVSALRDELEALQPDVVHAHGTGLYAGAAVGGRWPSVITVHGIVYREARLATDIKDRLGWELDGLYERWVLARAKRIIAISPYVEREFRHWTKAITHLIENPIADAFFDAPAHGEVGRILFAGRVIPRKDPLTAIRALGHIRTRHPEAQLRIAGEMDVDPAYTRMARKLVDELGLKNAVHFLGQLDEETILAEYRACSLLILSSVQETAPVVVEQALAAGRPVIATAVGGTGALVADGETGFIVPAGDDEGLAERACRLLDDSMLYDRMAAEARRQAQQHFKVSAVVDRTLDVYRELRFAPDSAAGGTTRLR